MTLADYMREIIGNGPAIPVSVFNGVTFVGDFAELVLDRRGRFQAQLCLCKPNSEIPDHGHPKVDSIVWMITGQLYFRVEVGGVMFEVWGPGDVTETKDGLCSANGKFIPVGPGVKHGAKIGPAGAAFLSFQEWLEGEPTSVEMDWEGPALSKEHEDTLVAAR